MQLVLHTSTSQRRIRQTADGAALAVGDLPAGCGEEPHDAIGRRVKEENARTRRQPGSLNACPGLEPCAANQNASVAVHVLQSSVAVPLLHFLLNTPEDVCWQVCTGWPTSVSQIGSHAGSGRPSQP